MYLKTVFGVCFLVIYIAFLGEALCKKVIVQQQEGQVKRIAHLGKRRIQYTKRETLLPPVPPIEVPPLALPQIPSLGVPQDATANPPPATANPPPATANPPPATANPPTNASPVGSGASFDWYAYYYNNYYQHPPPADKKGDEEDEEEA